ncbi:MAG: DUF3768 domain-containing protein [Sphingorhabdus sp.]|uniref:DUF3768 domain-containing protein n=1 Tax=Sphingorhabdus sp. TaxID=1902408 RepID=UPI003C8D4EE3
MTTTMTAADSDAARATECARLNDLCRAGNLKQSRTVFTRGCIDAFCDSSDRLSLFAVQAALMDKVRGHVFAGGDDPHCERDFGAFEYEGERLFWKIDYYDPTLTFGSEDPTDLAKTQRVLTIMLANDY